MRCRPPPPGGDHGDHDHDNNSSAKVLLEEGLSSPKGLAVNADKNLVVAQGAFGAPGPVLEFFLRGPQKGTAVPVTDPFGIIDVAISPKDGTGWAIGPVEAVDPTTGEPISISSPTAASSTFSTSPPIRPTIPTRSTTMTRRTRSSRTRTV